MKLFKLIYLFAIVLISCKENAVKNKTDKYETINIYDSIMFDSNTFYPGITITDYNRNKNLLLGFDWNSKDILLINTVKKKIKIFNKFGSGPGEYNDIRGLSFFNDSTFIILSLSSVIFYDLNSNPKITKSLKFTNIFIGYNLFKFNIPFTINDNNDTIVFVRHYNYNLEKGNYKKIFWLTEINLTEKSVNKAFKLYKDNPLFNLAGFRYDRATPSYSDVIHDSLIYFLFPFEPTLYCYNIHNKEIIHRKSVTYNIKNFNAIKYKRTSGSTKSFEISQLTDYCINFFVDNDDFILQYSKGISEEKIVKTRVEYVENNIENYRNEFLINRNVKNKDQKTFILNEKEYKYRILYIISKDEIFLLKNGINDEEIQFKIFIAKQ